MVPSITKNFQVTIICEVFTLAYFTAPANMFVEPDVTAQPVSNPFAVSQVPNCQNTVSFAFTTAPPTFVSL